MQIFQRIFTASNRPHFDALPVHRQNQLILVFGSTALLSDSGHFDAIRSAFPGGLVVGCSTAGEIHGTEVSDDTLVVTEEGIEVFTADAPLDVADIGATMTQDGLPVPAVDHLADERLADERLADERLAR